MAETRPMPVNDDPNRERLLCALVEHCISARQLIDAIGTPAMRALIDTLLFEIGTAIAADSDPNRTDEN